MQVRLCFATRERARLFESSVMSVLSAAIIFQVPALRRVALENARYFLPVVCEERARVLLRTQERTPRTFACISAGCNARRARLYAAVHAVLRIGCLRGAITRRLAQFPQPDNWAFFSFNRTRRFGSRRFFLRARAFAYENNPGSHVETISQTTQGLFFSA